MPENDGFVAAMAGIRFVRLMGELAGLPSAAALERAHEALYAVGLGEARYRPIGSYSLGMRQQAKLAQAIVHAPKLLLLDEPTNGLDPPARRRMLRLVRDIVEKGETRVILSSHLLRDVEECCDEVLVLKEGRIAVHCDLAEERRLNRRFLEVEAEGDAEALAAAATALGCECALVGRRLKLVLPEGVAVRDVYQAAARAEVELRRLAFRRDSLEDIFLKAMEAPDGGV